MKLLVKILTFPIWLWLMGGLLIFAIGLYGWNDKTFKETWRGLR